MPSIAFYYRNARGKKLVMNFHLSPSLFWYFNCSRYYSIFGERSPLIFIRIRVPFFKRHFDILQSLLNVAFYLRGKQASNFLFETRQKVCKTKGFLNQLCIIWFFPAFIAWKEAKTENWSYEVSKSLAKRLFLQKPLKSKHSLDFLVTIFSFHSIFSQGKIVDTNLRVTDF